MKIIDDVIKCKYCNEIFDDPIILICCSESICKKHVNEIKYLNSEEKFICFNCNHVHELELFPMNKTIMKLIESKFDKFNFGKEYEDSKRKCNNLSLVTKQLETLINNPKSHVIDFVKNIKIKMELRREEIKNSIDSICMDLLEDIALFEIGCYENMQNVIDLKGYKNKLKKIKGEFDVEKCLEEFETFEIDKLKWEKYLKSAENQINIVNNLLRSLKDDLLQGKACKFQKSINLDQFRSEFQNEFRLQDKYDKSIKLEINEFSNYFSNELDWLETEYVEYGCFRFNLVACIEKDKEDEEHYLGIYLGSVCEEVKNYPISVKALFKLKNIKDREKDLSLEFKCQFKEDKSRGFPNFIKIKDLILEGNEFYDKINNKLTIEVDFSVKYLN